MTSRPAQDGAQLQTGEQSPLPLLHEDERRAELLVDVVAPVLILVVKDAEVSKRPSYSSIHECSGRRVGSAKQKGSK
jgi:hypothetical protein